MKKMILYLIFDFAFLIFLFICLLLRFFQIIFRTIKWSYINKCPLCGKKDHDIVFNKLVSQVPSPDIRNNIYISNKELDFIVCYECHKSYCLDKEILNTL